MLAILGITFLATLSSSSLSKGVLAGGIGLAISAVGIEDHTGTLRYTMGTIYLWEGLSLAPVVVGLFAIPEIVDLAVRGSSISESKVGRISGVMEGVKDTFRHFWLTMRCGMIGVMVGAVPGVGGGVSQWMAYAHAVQSSKDKSRFGKGAVEGVLGPGAANNSKEGGNLIPDRSVRSSGDHRNGDSPRGFSDRRPDARPGNADQAPRRHPRDGVDTGHLQYPRCRRRLSCFSAQLVKLTFVRGNLLIPFLLVFVFLGAFSANNDFADIVVGLCFRRAGLFYGPFRMAEGSVRSRPRLGEPCGEVPRDLAGRLRHRLASPPRP